jgi:hypothetical protein
MSGETAELCAGPTRHYAVNDGLSCSDFAGPWLDAFGTSRASTRQWLKEHCHETVGLRS